MREEEGGGERQIRGRMRMGGVGERRKMEGDKMEGRNMVLAMMGHTQSCTSCGR